MPNTNVSKSTDGRFELSSYQLEVNKFSKKVINLIDSKKHDEAIDLIQYLYDLYYHYQQRGDFDRQNVWYRYEIA